MLDSFVVIVVVSAQFSKCLKSMVNLLIFYVEQHNYSGINELFHFDSSVESDNFIVVLIHNNVANFLK